MSDIRGEKLKSSSSEKLLGLHVSSSLDWKIHVEKLSIELRKRIGLLRRIKYKVTQEKLGMIAESIFNSKLRYGISVYACPVYEDEDLKMEKLPQETKQLQTLQNSMLRTIFGFNISQQINMKKLRMSIQMMSVNQMCVYHTLIETFNVIRNSSSEHLKEKLMPSTDKSAYGLRTRTREKAASQGKPSRGCIGFAYHSSKLWNKIPQEIRSCQSSSGFKDKVKMWIWNSIPSF